MLIQSSAAHVYIIGDVTFMPGVNKVPKEQWDKIKSHPHIKPRMTKGLLEMISDKESEDGFTSLSAYKPTEASKLIDATFDVGLLNDWKTAETRKDVRAYIMAQLKKIEGEAFKSDETGTVHFKN